ncbi:uncharacterized protein LOC121244832 [Juglans microcarpa x Juglans regia]|uniref:uncharacterized protein LOC121244832 n=1 Tax=Juglans microcarpa x Juglans regia TaxID=2249226 RepID=UPI001B7E03B4|nr:uncharacterized protein LOC121244832 [Juglans microcarpa x Juglans regia]
MHKRMQQHANIQWIVPPFTWLKLNWDVAFREEDYRIGVGVVIQDSEVEVLATLMQPLTFYLQPDIAEARGLLTSTRMCKELNVQDVIFEWDSNHVVTTMRQSTMQNGILSCFVEDTKATFLDTNWKIHHVRRDANKVAYQLAKTAVSFSQETFDIGYVDPCIISLVMAKGHNTG